MGHASKPRPRSATKPIKQHRNFKQPVCKGHRVVRVANEVKAMAVAVSSTLISMEVGIRLVRNIVEAIHGAPPS